MYASRISQTLLILVLVLSSSVLLASQYLCDFSSDKDGTELAGAERLRRFHPVPPVPDVKISMPDPAYRTYEGKPAGFGYFGGLRKLPGGTLVAWFDERPADHSHYGASGSRGVARVSSDGGKTWGPPDAISGTCVLPDGTMWGSTVHQDGRWVILTYIDRASKRGAPIPIPFPGPFPARPHIVLSNGDVIYEPIDQAGAQGREVYFRKGMSGPLPGPKGGSVRSIVLTDLNVSKWDEVSLINVGYLGDEFSVTETRNPGEIVILARNQSLSNFYYQSVSTDYGRTWSKGEPSSVWFSTQPSKPFVMTLSDGTLLALNGERANGRIIATPSLDDGKSWDLSRRLVVCDSPTEFFRDADFSYPDAVEVAPGRVLVRYYAASVRDVMTQWGDWGNFLDTTCISHPFRGARIALSHAPIGADPIGFWSFDDDQASVANDSVNSNYGRVHGALRVPGRFDKALRLRGPDARDYVEIVDSPSMRVGNHFAFEICFRADDTSRQQALVSKRPFYYLGIRDGRLVFEIGDPSRRRSPLFYAVSGATALESGRWYHAAVATGVHWDGYRKMHLFLDGKPEVDVRGWERTYPPSLSHVPGNAAARTYAEVASIIDERPESGSRFWNLPRRNESSDNLLLGCDCLDKPADFLQGEIDEFVLYNSYLYPPDVEALAARACAPAASVTSPVIRKDAKDKWTRFWARFDAPPQTSVAFSVLDPEGNTLLADVRPDADLAALNAPALRLRAELRTQDPHVSPVLWQWAIAPEEPQLIDHKPTEAPQPSTGLPPAQPATGGGVVW
ncbi:MAG: sialidase family protein [Planctomycetota bacterium]